MNMEDIGGLIQKLREYVNSPRKQNILLRDRNKWNKLCASMDAIEDSSFAISEYIKDLERKESLGFTYVIVYGILQAMILQQDSLMTISESLNIKSEQSTELKEVKEIRNSSIGHPVREKGKTFVSANYIQQMGMTIKSFTMMTFDPLKADPIFKNVFIPEMLSRQNVVISKELENILTSLKIEEKEHKEYFMNVKLAAYFNGFPYSISKVYEALSRPDYVSISLLNLTQIKASIDSAKDELNKRDLLGNLPGIDMVLKEIERPLEKLINMLENKVDFVRNDAYVYMYFCHKKIEEFVNMLNEIDEEYYK